MPEAKAFGDCSPTFPSSSKYPEPDPKSILITLKANKSVTWCKYSTQAKFRPPKVTYYNLGDRTKYVSITLCTEWVHDLKYDFRLCVNFTNILKADFTPILLRQRRMNPNLNYTKLRNKTFIWKSCAQNVGVIYTMLKVRLEKFNSTRYSDGNVKLILTAGFPRFLRWKSC